MRYIIYDVRKEQKLSTLAKELNTTPEAIKELNPKMRTFGSFMTGGVYVSYGQKIKIPVPPSSVEEVLKDVDIPNQFDRKARYRCKQSNLVKYEDVPVSNSSVRSEYIFGTNNDIALVEVKETYYSFVPNMNHLEEFLTYSDQLKDKVLFRTNKDGKPNDVLNLNYLIKNWDNAKSTQFHESTFVKEIKKQPNNEYQKMIDAGDAELNEVEALLTSLESNLFYKEIMGQYLCKNFDNFSPEKLKTQSNLFKNIILEADLLYSKIKEDDEVLSFRKMSELDTRKIDETELIKQYNEVYKPLVKFNFSDYSYSYRMTADYNKKEKLLDMAHITILEQIKNNISFSIDFTIKKIEL